MWKPSDVNSWVNSAAAPVTPDALATMATAPSVTNGMVVVVVGGSVVVVVVVVVDVVVVDVVGVVVDDVEVVVASVVVVATDGGPNVHAASTSIIDAVEMNSSRRANIRSSCPVGNSRTSHRRESGPGFPRGHSASIAV